MSSEYSITVVMSNLYQVAWRLIKIIRAYADNSSPVFAVWGCGGTSADSSVDLGVLSVYCINVCMNRGAQTTVYNLVLNIETQLHKIKILQVSLIVLVGVINTPLNIVT